VSQHADGLDGGRAAAADVDAYLMTSTRLPWQGGIPKRDWIAPPIGKAYDAAHRHTLDDDVVDGFPGQDAETVSVTA
jgi:hypothetical protein